MIAAGAAAALSLLAGAVRAREPAVLNAPAPELTGGAWINTEDGKPVRLADRTGKVTVLHFWTFG